ncbi:MAG: 50S ribosomal protein L29 [Deltaproteobacteria bacterium]|nr:50S ribosomal protein L29 [Deltaproteobacteria bacterium]
MKAKALRDITEVELKNKLSALAEENFNLRFQKAIGQLENRMKVHNNKKDIARIRTVLRERQIGIHTGENEAGHE